MRDAVALFDAKALQHVGEFADPLVQLLVGDGFLLGGIVAFPDDRNLVAPLRQMPINTVRRHVERAVLVPFDRDVIYCPYVVFFTLL